MDSNASSSANFDPLNPLLGGVYGKMNRAVDHVKALDEWFEEWINTNPWSTPTEANSKGIAKRIYFKITNPIPTWTGLVVGDAIHNLRCALDHLAAAMAVKSDKTTKGVYFPIAPSLADYPAMRRDKLRKCPESFRDFVDKLQPYKGGNDLLYALHQLDIIDKHQVLIPVGAGSEITIDANAGFYGAIDFSKTDRPVKLKSLSKGGVVKDGDTIINFGPSFWLPQKTEIRTETSISIVFGEDTPVANSEIGTTIKDMVRAVESVVIRAEPLFFR